MFERETKREKILEARNREIRLKQKAKSSHMIVNAEGEEVEEALSAEETMDINAFFLDKEVLAAEKDFHQVIELEMRLEEPLEEIPVSTEEETTADESGETSTSPFESGDEDGTKKKKKKKGKGKKKKGKGKKKKEGKKDKKKEGKEKKKKKDKKK